MNEVIVIIDGVTHVSYETMSFDCKSNCSLYHKCRTLNPYGDLLCVLLTGSYSRMFKKYEGKARNEARSQV